MAQPVEWNLDALVRPNTGDATQNAPFAILVLNHALRNTPTFRTLWSKASFRVAADGGADRLAALLGSGDGLEPPCLDAIVGDLDSLSAASRILWSRTPHPPRLVEDQDQDRTDFAKAVEHIRSEHPGLDIAVVGGLGGRLDQAVSVLHHMYALQDDQTRYSRGRMYLVSGGDVAVLLKSGRHAIRVTSGDDDGAAGGSTVDMQVGIGPLREKSVITTKGLHWDVEGWETQVGGQISTSNRVASGVGVVEVEASNDVLFTIQLRAEDEGEVGCRP